MKANAPFSESRRRLLRTGGLVVRKRGAGDADQDGWSGASCAVLVHAQAGKERIGERGERAHDRDQFLEIDEQKNSSATPR